MPPRPGGRPGPLPPRAAGLRAGAAHASFESGAMRAPCRHGRRHAAAAEARKPLLRQHLLPARQRLRLQLLRGGMFCCPDRRSAARASGRAGRCRRRLQDRPELRVDVALLELIDVCRRRHATGVPPPPPPPQPRGRAAAPPPRSKRRRNLQLLCASAARSAAALQSGDTNGPDASADGRGHICAHPRRGHTRLLEAHLGAKAQEGACSAVGAL